MTESRLTAAIIRRLKALRASADSPLWWCKLHGGPLQRAGLPDFLVVYRGLCFFFEAKRPGAKPTKLQAHTMAELARAGAIVAVVTSVDEVMEVLTRETNDVQDD